ncbi:MAG TPA: hypothetical protein VGB73_16600 [Pyrinomonadaceae bacterium]|jgi:hypothetical protein
MQHRVPIVAGKTTVVRVYLSYESDKCVAVRGVLSLTLPGGETKQFNSFQSVEVNPALNGDVPRKRRDAGASLNFRIPDSEIVLPAGQTTGKLRAQLSLIEYDPAGPRTCQNIAMTAEALACDNCLSKFREVDVIDSPTLRIRLVGLDYVGGDSGAVHTPTTQDVSLTKSWLARAYPVARAKLLFVPGYSTIDAVISPNFRYACNDANSYLVDLRGTEIANRLATLSTRYFGLVSDKGGFMEGCSSQPPGAVMFPPAVASGPTGSPAQYEDYQWDTDDSYADFYTGHELAHTMGRKHPGFCNDNTNDDKEYEFQGGKLSNQDEEFIGFDVGDYELTPSLPMRALPGTEWTDVMTYCAKRWLSSYTYNAILSRLLTENRLDPTPAPTPPPLPVPLSEGFKATSTATAQSMMITSGLAEETSKASQDDGLDRGDFIQVVATVNLDKLEGRITSARRRSITTGANVAVKRAGHPIMIRLRDKDDKPLGQFFVRPYETNVEPERPDLNIAEMEGEREALPASQPPSEAPAGSSGLIDAIIPYITGAAKIELILFKKEGETEIESAADTYIVGKRPPQTGKLRLTGLNLINSVNVIAPATKDATILVSWESKVIEGQQVAYKVEVSSDEDAGWQTLAAGLTRPNYEIALEQLPKGTTSFRIRVTASDGFNSTTVTSKRVSLP